MSRFFLIELREGDGNDCFVTDLVIEAENWEQALDYCESTALESLAEDDIEAEVEQDDHRTMVSWTPDICDCCESIDESDCECCELPIHYRDYCVSEEYATEDDALSEISSYHSGPVVITQAEVEEQLGLE